MIKDWPLVRKEQFVALIGLIDNVGSLDQTTNAISILQTSIADAKFLNETDFDKNTPSFMSFIRDELNKP